MLTRRSLLTAALAGASAFLPRSLSAHALAPDRTVTGHGFIFFDSYATGSAAEANTNGTMVASRRGGRWVIELDDAMTARFEATVGAD